MQTPQLKKSHIAACRISLDAARADQYFAGRVKSKTYGSQIVLKANAAKGQRSIAPLEMQSSRTAPVQCDYAAASR